MSTPRDPASPDTPPEQRLAKLLARAGVASRREVERMVEEGRIALNGIAIETPATLLASLAGITVDGRPVEAPEPTRLFLYHKPAGLLVTERDPAGRPTIYDRLPTDLPRVVPVGRLDLSTEGLLLLTTDGAFKRELELPATGVQRAYRARAYGHVTQPDLEALIEGVEIEGVRYGPIDANLERRTGANQWIELVLTEGKNREVRRVLEYLGLEVSRLIRTRYGPFVLGDLPPGAVGEVRGVDIAGFRQSIRAGKPVTERRVAVAVRGGMPAGRGDAAEVGTTPRAGPHPSMTAPDADRRLPAERSGRMAGGRQEGDARPADRPVPRRASAPGRADRAGPAPDARWSGPFDRPVTGGSDARPRTGSRGHRAGDAGERRPAAQARPGRADVAPHAKRSERHDMHADDRHDGGQRPSTRSVAKTSGQRRPAAAKLARAGTPDPRRPGRQDPRTAEGLDPRPRPGSRSPRDEDSGDRRPASHARPARTDRAPVARPIRRGDAPGGIGGTDGERAERSRRPMRGSLDRQTAGRADAPAGQRGARSSPDTMRFDDRRAHDGERRSGRAGADGPARRPNRTSRAERDAPGADRRRPDDARPPRAGAGRGGAVGNAGASQRQRPPGRPDASPVVDTPARPKRQLGWAKAKPKPGGRPGKPGKR